MGFRKGDSMKHSSETTWTFKVHKAIETWEVMMTLPEGTDELICGSLYVHA
jgi:hypothetical protein